MQIFYVEVFSCHIRGTQHVLDVASICSGLGAIACLVGDHILAKGGRSELVLLVLIHDDRAVLMRVVALHGVCSSPILGMIHGRNCCTTPGRCLQR